MTTQYNTIGGLIFQNFFLRFLRLRERFPIELSEAFSLHVTRHLGPKPSGFASRFVMPFHSITTVLSAVTSKYLAFFLFF